MQVGVNPQTHMETVDLIHVDLTLVLMTMKKLRYNMKQESSRCVYSQTW